MTNLDSILKSRDITLPTKVHIVKAMVFPAVMYRCESWTIKKAEHQRTDAFELWCWKRLERSLDFKEIKPVNPKGNQPWIFIGRTDTEAPTCVPPDGKSLLIGKDLDAGRMEGRRKGQQRWLDEMRWIVVWHHWLNRHELEQTLGDSEGQENLVCCNPWGRKESDRETEQLENQEVSMCALNKPAISEVHS